MNIFIGLLNFPDSFHFTNFLGETYIDAVDALMIFSQQILCTWHFPTFYEILIPFIVSTRASVKKLAMLSILILPYQCTAKYRGHKAVPDPTRVCNFCDVPSLDCCAKWIESRIPSWPLSTRTWQAEAQHPLLFPVGSPSISSPAALVEVQPVAFRLICKTKQTKCWETWIGVELSSSLCNEQPNHRDQQQFSSRVWLIQSSCLKSATRKIKN